jgi:hypothetical protein
MSDPSPASPVLEVPTTAPGRLAWLLHPRDTLVLILGVVLAIALHRALFGYANYYEFAHFAEIAKNMANGEGFVSYSAQPASLAWCHERGLAGPPWPVAERFIGYPALLSLLFRVFGVHDGVVLGANMVVFAALVTVLFQTGVRLFDRQSARLACVLFLLNPLFTFNYALYGFLDPFFGLIVWAVSLGLLGLPESRRPLRRVLLVGVLYALAHLVRYNALILAPLYLVFVVVLAPTRRLLSAALFALPVALSVVGLVAYNLAAFGQTGTYLTSSWVMAEYVVAGAEPWRLYEVYASWDILRSSWDAVLTKFSNNVTDNILRDVTRLYNLQLLIPFAIHGFFVAAQPRQRRLLAIVGLPLLCQFLLFALSHPELGTPLRWTDRYYFWGAILVLLFGAFGVRTLIGGLAQGRAFIALFVALTVASFSSWWRPAPGFDPDTFYARDYLQGVPKGSIVATNRWHNSVSLYYGTATIELPHDPDVIGDVARHWPLDVVLVTADPPGTRTLPAPWVAMMNDEALRDAFGRVHGFTVDRLFTGEDGTVVGMALRSTRPQPASSTPP